MKLAFTIANAGDLIHAGGEVTRETYLVDVPDSVVPRQVLDLKPMQSMSISVVHEPQTDCHPASDKPEDQWNVHEHRDELRVTRSHSVYHPDRGILCTREQRYDAFFWHPIVFTNAAAARMWIDFGSIAELQEGLGDLSVCFSDKSFELRNA